MTDTIRNQSDLVFFTHIIGGNTYGAWYRLLPAECIEILAIGLIQTIPLDGRQPGDVACNALEIFVRARHKLGQPVPSLPTEVVAHAHHTCPPKPSERATH
jgi:hypothetical protein